MGRPILVWILLGTIWGSTWLVIKIGVAETPPFTFAWIRFLIALAPLLLIMKIGGNRFPKNVGNWITIIVSGTCYFSINYALIYWGETRISSGLAAILYTTLPLFGLFNGHFFIPNEKITVLEVVGVFLGLAGVTIIFLDQLHLEGYHAVWGVVAIVSAAFICSIGGVVVKRYARDMDAVTLTAGQVLVGLVPLCALGLLVEGSPFSLQWSATTLGGLFYLGLIGTALTFALLNWLFKHMAYSRIQLLPFSSTLIAVVLGHIILEERIHWRIIFGMASILLGLFLATLRRRTSS